MKQGRLCETLALSEIRTASGGSSVVLAERAEAPVSLENCRQLDPQTRIAMFSRLDVSPAETPTMAADPARRHPCRPAARDR